MLKTRLIGAWGWCAPYPVNGQTIIKEQFYVDKAHKNLLHIEITLFDDDLTRPWTVARIPQAMLTMLDNPTSELFVHLRFWAPFVVVGGPAKPAK